MEKRRAIFIFIIFIIGVGFTFKKFNKNVNYSSTTSGLIVDKEIKPYRIILRKFGENTREIEEIEIIIKDENVWNLIEKERYYFVTYFWKNNEIPILGQIEVNDEFGKIYKEKLNK